MSIYKKNLTINLWQSYDRTWDTLKINLNYLLIGPQLSSKFVLSSVCCIALDEYNDVDKDILL